MHLGRLLLRLAIGGTFFVHGTQKLFGWFGGYGPDGTGQFFESLGLRPGRRNAMAAGCTETAGGLMIATGIATPIAAAGLAGVMITALRTAIWKEGVKPATGEFEVLLAVAGVALAETGPGRPALGDPDGGSPALALAALAAGAIGAELAIRQGSKEPATTPAAAPVS